ncbi:MAG: LPS export ABC transporter periplasmic protein LptC [Fusobacterium sp.]|nr:LPS export ABC transporter periplasmic protein LptC [Fusobacterium sp.]
MTKKKFFYIIGGIAIVILGYFNYFSDEGEIKDIKKTIETKNAVYQSEDYYVEAEKEIDYIDEKESKFEKAKAKIRDIILTGDNAFLDKARNLILKSNIVALSPKGWKINASELKYEKASDSLVSNEFVSIKNEKKGIEITGNRLKTNVSMDYVTLDKGVTIKNKFYSLVADSANYDSKTKKIILDGNIKVIGNTKENKDKISGTFNKVYHDVDKRNTYASEGFNLFYDGIDLSGKNIVLNDNEETFSITENIKIKYQDYIFDLNKIEKEKNTDIVKFYGEITGGNQKYSLKANSGEYNIKNKIFRIFGNIEAKSTDENLAGEVLADEIRYNTESKDIELIANANNKVKYISKINNLEGEYFIFNRETKILKTDKEFFAINNKNQSVKGDNLTYNIDTKDLRILNNIIFKDDDYIAKTKNIDFDSKTSILTVPEDFEIDFIKQNMKLKGSNIIYNKLTEELATNNPIKLYNNGTEISGKNLVYNNKTLLGKIEGVISIKNPKEKISGTAKEIVFKKDNYAKLIGAINIKKDKTSIDTDTVNYLYTDKKIHSTSVVNFKDREKNMQGELIDLVYDPKTKEGTAKNLKLKDSQKDVKADKVFIYNERNELDLVGNVVLNYGTDKINTQKLTYNLKTNDMEIKTRTKVSYKDYVMNFNSGLINKETGAISLKNAEIENTKGDKFSAEKIYGNLDDGLIHFRNKVKGKTKHKDGDIKFSGEKVDLYLEKEADKYVAKKIIIDEKSEISQLNKTVKADYIEVDLVKNMVYSKKRPKLFVKNIDNNPNKNIEVEADEIDANLTTKIANLRKNIFAKVKTIDKKNNKIKNVELVAQRAVVSEKVVDIYENIKIADEDAVIKADEGHYYIDTNKVKAKGNVRIDYVKGAR